MNEDNEQSKYNELLESIPILGQALEMAAEMFQQCLEDDGFDLNTLSLFMIEWSSFPIGKPILLGLDKAMVFEHDGIFKLSESALKCVLPLDNEPKHVEESPFEGLGSLFG